MNKKCSPSGKKTGQRCETIFVASYAFSVSGPRLLPSAFIFHNQPAACGEKTITPLRLQLPPRPLVAVASAWGVPPETATFFNLPSAKNATYASSGDQNG